jgi:transcription initiation factor TFIIF subunit beta
MADTAIKPEIKLDPVSGHSPSNMSTIEAFEEDVDLQIPPLPTEGGQQAWLVKVPDYIWKAWNEMYQTSADDEPIEIGKMRVYEGDMDPLKQKIQIKLTAGVPSHQGLPLTYDLNLHTNGYSNNVVFSEKDLPGHYTGPGSRNSRRPQPPGLKPSGIPSKADRYGPTRPGSYRTSIPKQVSLAPLVHHVADATPVQDDAYWKHFKKNYDSALKPKATTAFQRGIDKSMHPAAVANRTTFNTFGITSRPKGAKKQVREKAVRISQQDLLDRLYQCFRKYRYWSLKALKTELKQPEAFIKSTLESIATLIRSGDFAMNYKLKDEYAQTADVKPEDVKEELAMIKSEDEDGEASGMEAEDAEMDDDLDDDEGMFEDVGMDAT